MSKRRRRSNRQANRQAEFYVYTPGVDIPRHVTHVLVPASVEELPNSAFLHFDHLKEVVLSTGLKRIGESAFRGCYSLVGVQVPATLVVIGAHAFRGCTSLREFEFPEGLARIGQFSFSGCRSLVCLRLPSTLTKITYGAFNRCTSLTKITLSDGIQEIGHRAFRDCISLKDDVVLPATVDTIGPLAFKGCLALRVLKLNCGVLRIQSGAFEDCDLLHHVGAPSKSLRATAVETPGSYDLRLVPDVNTSVPSLPHVLITSEFVISMSSAEMSEFQLEIAHILGPLGTWNENWLDEAWADKLQSLLALVAEHELRHKTEVATLLELGFWKLKIMEEGLNPDIREDCRVRCGAGVIIGSVLSFLLSSW